MSKIRDEVITMLLAGHETTALTLSWTWYLLRSHPAVDAQLAEEVHTVLGDRSLTVNDLPRLRYTGQVVSEAMRLYPPAYAIGRESVADCATKSSHSRRSYFASSASSLSKAAL